MIDLVTFSADIHLREARGTELPTVDVPVTLETAAYEPRIVSMSIRPSVIEIEPGVDRQAVAAVEVELPDAGLPPELNPGVNVTLSLYRVDGHGSVLVETTPCCVGVCCHTEFVADGGHATFVFTLDPVEATVPAGERELRFEARIGNRSCILPLAETHPDRSETGSLLLGRAAQKTARIKTTTFNPATTHPGGSSTLTVTVETENVTSLDFLQVYVELVLPSFGCGLSTTLEPGQRNPLGRLGSSSGMVDFRFTIIVPAVCSVPSGTATWKADLVNLPPDIIELRPVQDTATLNIQPSQQATYIKPRVISLAVGQSKQLTPEDQTCQPMQQFPPGTTFTTRTLATPPADGASIATINDAGGITARSKGVVNADATLPGRQYPLNCSVQGCSPEDKPLIQVGPMTIYLRFPSDTIVYMTGHFPGQGLGLNATEVEQVKMKAREHLFHLFQEVGANVSVTTEQPGGFREGAWDDGIITMDVVAKKIPGTNMFERTRTWNDPPSGPTEQGFAPVNELNWVSAVFGIDAIGPDRGVFINRLALINERGLRVTLDEIGYGIANIAAHEVGHTLGMVPNAASEQQRTEKKDERFANINFDGNDDHHAGEQNRHIMQTNTTRVGERPRYLTNEMHFRREANRDQGYLQTILPRP